MFFMIVQESRGSLGVGAEVCDRYALCSAPQSVSQSWWSVRGGQHTGGGVVNDGEARAVVRGSVGWHAFETGRAGSEACTHGALAG